MRSSARPGPAATSLLTPPPDAVKVAVREEEEYVEPEPVEDQEEAGRQVLNEGGYRPLRGETSSRCG